MEKNKNIIEIDAEKMSPRELNGLIRSSDGADIINCCGQRFIGSGMNGKSIVIHGTPGNALGSYLDGAEIEVFGNCQEAAGDTMNDGMIVIHGNAGDALGYAMRGGEIYVRGDAGYRAGVHIKEYGQKRPVIVIGGSAGSFLGEYQAGGIIILLGKNCEALPYGSFPSAGMHGGKIYIRSKIQPEGFSKQVKISKATEDDLNEIQKYLKNYSRFFGETVDEQGEFYVVTPDENNPYKRLYTVN